MKTIRLSLPGERKKSLIVCRKNVLSACLAPRREELQRGGGIVFTDSNVYRLYGKLLSDCLDGVPVHVMEAGEEHKNTDTLLSLLHAMAEGGLRRNSVLIAFGGGVVGDIGGLAASLYMRGISCIQVPTTLLSQVDSSVGGKTAVDFGGVKNLVGAFFQPSFVYADPLFFKTLPPRELRCGLGEIVKHGALCPSLFEKLLLGREKLFDLSFLGEIVPENIAFKASVVGRDPTETGERKCLNLGHTTAHAIELSGTGYGHGECVLLGLMLEGKIAERTCGADKPFLDSLFSLCRTVLPGKICLPPLRESARLALLDKKNRTEGTVTLTLPVAAGRYEIAELPAGRYARLLEECKEELCFD